MPGVHYPADDVPSVYLGFTGQKWIQSGVVQDLVLDAFPGYKRTVISGGMMGGIDDFRCYFGIHTNLPEISIAPPGRTWYRFHSYD